MEGLPAVILARRLCGGVEGWPAEHLMAASLTVGRIQGLRMIPIHKLF